MGHINERHAMTTTPGRPENDAPRSDANADDDDSGRAEPQADGTPGAEIGVTEGEGSTFEPEEDPDAGS